MHENNNAFEFENRRRNVVIRVIKIRFNFVITNVPADRQWGGITHRLLEKFWKAGLASDIGLSLLPIYRVTNNPDGFPDTSWTKLIYGAHKLNSNELKELNSECNANYKYSVNEIDL